MELLEKHFNIAFAAPDGIKKLRQLILTLAMQGKLLPQDSKDQSASELLIAIDLEKKRLVKEGKNRAQSPLPEIKLEDAPYDLPRGWRWVRLGEVGFWKSGTTPSRSNSAYYGGAIPWVKSGEVKQGRISSTEETITEKALSECSLNINPVGAVLIAMYGANIGEVGILEIEATTNQAVCACTTYSLVDQTFLLNLLMSIKPNFIVQGAGAAQPNISREKIINTIVPLPPLAEQRRIVVRIDQLMARCVELEKLRVEREQKRLTVHTAALNRLLMATESNDFSTAWRFITQHFGELYSVKEHVAELRKAVLQLAVMGKLVPQDPHDKPASQLLKEIEAEKKRLVKEGKIKEPKSLPVIKPEEVPYRLPTGWEWVRLGTLMPEFQNGISKRDSKIGADTIVLRLADIYRNEISCADTRSIRLTEKEQSQYLLQNTDLLITRVNGSVDLVGSFIRVRENNLAVAYCDHFIRMRMPENYIYTDYLHTISKSSLVRRQIEEKFVTTAGQKTVNQTHIMTLQLSVPPLAEQRRIVAKINHLMVLCDELDKHIDDASCKQTELLTALMSQA